LHVSVTRHAPFVPAPLPRGHRAATVVPPLNLFLEIDMHVSRQAGRILIGAVVVAAIHAFAPARALHAQAPPAAKPEDVASKDAILAALYDVISGPAGHKRDWNRYNSLFVPGARLIPAVRREGGGASARVMTPEEYATTSGPVLERNGFFEKQIASKVEEFGNIAHVFSTYESRRTAADEKPFSRGINSIQLLRDGNRWWVVSIFWDSERPDNPIPAKYLTGN
jgi:hypothetical protein